MSDETPPAVKNAEAAGLKPDNIAQIRELLFGQFQRETESRFARAEERADRTKAELDEQIGLVRSKFDEQLELLRAKLSKDVGHLDERLSKELADLTARFADAERAQAETDRKQDEARVQAIEDVGARLKTAEEQLRAELRAEAQQAQRALDALRSDFETATRQLTDVKTNRMELADHLIEIGSRLKAAPSFDDVEAQLAGLVAQASAQNSDG